MTENTDGVSRPHIEETSDTISVGRIVRALAMVAILGFAIHLLLPQLGSLRQGLEALSGGRWRYLFLAVIGSALTFVAGAWMVRASVDQHLPWKRTVVMQMAAAAAAIVTPMRVGWAAVTQGYLIRRGVPDASASAATALNLLLTFASNVGLLLITLPFLPSLKLPVLTPPPGRRLVDIFVVVAIVVGVVFWIPRIRHKTLSVVKPILEAVPGVIKDPRRSLEMVAASVAGNLAFSLALWGALAAFGETPSLLGVLVAYLAGAAVAAIAPTPGGLGAMETALIATLTRLGTPTGQAVAATLAFRIATFWLILVAGGIALRVGRRRSWV